MNVYLHMYTMETKRKSIVVHFLISLGRERNVKCVCLGHCDVLLMDPFDYVSAVLLHFYLYQPLIFPFERFSFC